MDTPLLSSGVSFAAVVMPLAAVVPVTVVGGRMRAAPPLPRCQPPFPRLPLPFPVSLLFSESHSGPFYLYENHTGLFSCYQPVTLVPYL
jgi:hypothetical protein